MDYARKELENWNYKLSSSILISDERKLLLFSCHGYNHRQGPDVHSESRAGAVQ